jgi:phosphatidylglycerophosphate synthase/phosphatidylglycerophosphatase A
MNKNKTILVNTISLSRVAVIIPVFFLTNFNYLFIVTLWAGLSDFLDGFLARKWEVTTALGIKIDQYADKIASLLFLIYFLKNQQLSYVFVVLIVVREILVLLFRISNWSKPDSNFMGKAKTFFLYVLFIYLSSGQLIFQSSVDFKIVLILLSIGCSWVSFFFSISKFTPSLIYALGTMGLTATLVKKAPGTITSFLVFLLLFFGLNEIRLESKIVVLILLLILHFVYYNLFLKQINSLNDDPSIYTLDETLAIVMAWVLLVRLSMIDGVILFSLFRFFDILKPLGIRSIEKKSNWSAAIRNIADDMAAMFYTLIIFKMIKIYVG